MERIQIDITYFNNKCELEDIRGKYLFNFKDHFSKFCKGFIINNKTADEIIKKFKIFIKEFGKPKLVQNDNGGEFTANIYKLFCEEQNIKYIYGSPHHPRSHGSVESFNKSIIYKLQYIKLEDPKNFDINNAIEKAFNIYNNTIHSTIKIEPYKAFHFKKKKQLNRVIKNIIKSQLDINKNSAVVQKGSRGLLSNKFKKHGKYLEQKIKKRIIYNSNYNRFCNRW